MSDDLVLKPEFFTERRVVINCPVAPAKNDSDPVSESARELNKAFADCFSTDAGKTVMAFLLHETVGKLPLPLEATESALRETNAAACLVREIALRTEYGSGRREYPERPSSGPRAHPRSRGRGSSSGGSGGSAA